jgi:hypothetical protein
MGNGRGCYSRKGVDGRFHWRSFRVVGFQGLLAVREVKVWGTAVVVTAVKASTVDSGVSGVLDSTGEGVSVVDCVTDGF